MPLPVYRGFNPVLRIRFCLDDSEGIVLQKMFKAGAEPYSFWWRLAWHSCGANATEAWAGYHLDLKYWHQPKAQGGYIVGARMRSKRKLLADMQSHAFCRPLSTCGRFWVPFTNGWLP